MPVSRTDFVVLGLLATAPQTGYAIKRTVDEAIAHFWRESFGQLYPTLRRLRDEGAIAEDGAGARGQVRYRITPAGRTRLAAWFAEPLAPSPPRQELLLKLFFGPLAPPGVLRAQLVAYRAAHAEALAGLGALATQLDEVPPSEQHDAPYWRLTASMGRHVLAALVAWADEALAELDRLDAAP